MTSSEFYSVHLDFPSQFKEFCSYDALGYPFYQLK